MLSSPPNKAMKQTKRVPGRPAAWAIFIKSRFAAYRRRWAAQECRGSKMRPTLFGMILLLWVVSLVNAQESSVLGEGRGIDEVIILVRDLEAAQDVYGNVLGFTLLPPKGSAAPLAYRAALPRVAHNLYKERPGQLREFTNSTRTTRSPANAGKEFRMQW